MATRVTLRRLEGLEFTAESGSGHRLHLDAGELVGGGDAGMRPTEAILLALGACSAMDVASILAKMRQAPSVHEVTVEAHQRDEHPRIFDSIKVTHRFEGDVAESSVRRAIWLSAARYCPVHAMLAASVAIADGYEIWRDGRDVARGMVPVDGETPPRLD